MSVNYERGNIVRDGYTTEAEVVAQNRMPWDNDHTGSITNYKSNIAYKTSDGYTRPTLSTTDSFFYNNGTGNFSSAAPGDYLIDTISGNQGTSWFTRTYDASPYISNTCRVIFHYTSGTSFTGDAQIAEVNLGTTAWDFETNNEGWQTTNVNSSTLTLSNYTTNGSLISVQNGTTTNRWNRDASGTGSSGTGIATAGLAQNGSWYLYAETSGAGYPSKDFFCHSPDIVVDNSTFNMILGMYGATMGTLIVYLRVIS